MTKLVCQRCGHEDDVVITTEDGESITGEDYLTLLGVAGEQLICDQCPTPAEWASGVETLLRTD